MQAENFRVINGRYCVNVLSVLLNFCGRIRRDLVLELVISRVTSTALKGDFDKLMFSMSKDTVFDVIVSISIK